MDYNALCDKKPFVFCQKVEFFKLNIFLILNQAVDFCILIAIFYIFFYNIKFFPKIIGEYFNKMFACDMCLYLFIFNLLLFTICV